MKKIYLKPHEKIEKILAHFEIQENSPLGELAIEVLNTYDKQKLPTNPGGAHRLGRLFDFIDNGQKYLEYDENLKQNVLKTRGLPAVEKIEIYIGRNWDGPKIACKTWALLGGTTYKYHVYAVVK